MKNIFRQVDGKWQCDYDALAAKTDRLFAVLDVKSIFNNHTDTIKLVDVSEDETDINILILTTGNCYELLYKKDTKEIYIDSISANAIERITNALNEQTMVNSNVFALQKKEFVQLDLTDNLQHGS